MANWTSFGMSTTTGPGRPVVAMRKASIGGLMALVALAGVVVAQAGYSALALGAAVLAALVAVAVGIVRV